MPGEFHGQRSLAGYSSWGHKESDLAEPLTHTHTRLCVNLGHKSVEFGLLVLIQFHLCAQTRKNLGYADVLMTRNGLKFIFM